MARPSKPTQASQRGEMHRFTVVVASSSATDHGPDLGLVATSHIDGGAVCGKSARTVLARGRVRVTARPTLQGHFSAGPSGAQPPENGLWAPSVTCRRSQPAAAARSTAWRGNARPGQAAQDGVGWRLRGFLVPGPRDGPTGKAGGGLESLELLAYEQEDAPTTWQLIQEAATKDADSWVRRRACALLLKNLNCSDRQRNFKMIDWLYGFWAHDLKHPLHQHAILRRPNNSTSA